MKKSFILLALFFSTSLIVTSCKDSKKDKEVEQTELGVEKADLAINDAYQCPMGCEKDKTYDKEGKCPVCNMTLLKVGKEKSGLEQDEHEHDEETDEQKEGE